MACFNIRISSRWRYPKVFIGLMVIELLGTVAALVMFGVADPDLYRTIMWQIGYDNGFNSNPAQVLYAYSNHRPIPKTPFVWSQTLTSFNVAIAVLCTFILLVKSVMFAMHIWWPLLNTVINVCVTALWAVSVYGQAGPDHSDPRHPSNSAWYVSKSCSYATASGHYHYCVLAKATFAVTVFMTAVFLATVVLGVWSMFPTAAELEADKIEIDEMQSTTSTAQNRLWELKSVPKRTPKSPSPYTPRTLAFNTLDRQLPLRESSGEN